MEDKFDAYSYDGDFPRNMNGSQIKTYQPTIIGGDIKVTYNGHDWNHAPFLKVSAAVFESVDTTGRKIIEIFASSLLDNDLSNPCSLEHLLFRVPSESSTIDLNKFADHFEDEIGVNFITANCDATKDRYLLDKTQRNWVKLVRYDTLNKEVKVQFDAHFRMYDRNPDFGPVFPETVHLNGTIASSITE
ncbi:hypothetical protein ACWKW6_12240 [Dyadobacter jiangsuensis]